ncbi:hypothetical protein AB0I22_14140 [Streptomyces sp. NPDC050610]|uniref:hypothetical protein n=1 Tax=Streptomyces sp. NPDC050610 TaxID=3157097 RepID=UPI003423AB7D
MENCGYNPIRDFYERAKAHGNTFVVRYVNGTSDTTYAWTERALDKGNLVTGVDVYC